MSVREVLGLSPVDPSLLERFGPPTYTEEQVLRYARLMQAREDAQPVAWLYETVGGFHTASVEALTRIDGHKVFGRPLYTHPAPDALRETFEDIKSAADSFRDCEGDEVAEQVILRCDQALAALQAEQGAK